MTINTLYELARNSVEKFASKIAFSMFEGEDVTCLLYTSPSPRDNV